jgi:class 3 adenylate cyclase
MQTMSSIHTSGSLQRLEALIAERLRHGADKAAVDARIWGVFGETWSVMFTDLSGFSRFVAEFGIIHFLQIIHESQRIFEPCIDANDGVLVKVEGDSMLVLFRRPAKAVECAIAMQRAAKEYNRDKIDAEKILLCVGIGYGNILTIGDQDVFGAEVNAASKLGEDTAKAWDILVTDSVAAEIRGMPGISIELIDTVPPGAKAAYKLTYTI